MENENDGSSLDNDVLEKAIISIGEELSRKNSTMVTEGDDEDLGENSLSDSLEEDDEDQAIKLQ